MEFEDILWEIDADGVAELTLNKPEKLNAISLDTVAEIEHAIAIANDDDNVRCVLLTGAGRGFSSGTDLTARGGNRVKRPFPGRSGITRSNMLGPAFVYACNKPTVAAVNGVCVGAGFSLALACDIRIASTEARFSSIFVKRAIVPDSGASWLLPRRVGLEHALRMMYTGRMVGADEAKEIGLISEIAPGEELMGRARDLAREIARGPSVAIEVSKKLVRDSLHRGIEEQVEMEHYYQNYMQQTEDVQEGRLAFVEKREPNFQGR
ncbi:MAG: hypothetical protein CL897_05825 [Dehalococcoidia bacterium]|nr:hypothetical protein [Dehalococcoidia bacterium]HCV00920.1 hypothetical protein [Dehalococcoidia bacterium]|tara:strand:- start:202 stop:996 length:795 start_codon:yes stop_codon:yes gene_type:complete